MNDFGNVRRLFSWIATNGGIAALAWLGPHGGNAWASNLLMFVLWFTTLTALFACVNDEVRRKAREKGPSVPAVINVGFSLTLAGFLAAYGWFLYATLVLLEAAFYSHLFYAETLTNAPDDS